jgi:hypothetical protein
VLHLFLGLDQEFSLMQSKLLEGMSDFDMADQLPNAGDVALINAGTRNMQAAMEQSAQSELGPDGYAKLQEMAKAAPAVNAALISCSIMRATGKADGVSWAQFMADVAGHMNG